MSNDILDYIAHPFLAGLSMDLASTKFVFDIKIPFDPQRVQAAAVYCSDGRLAILRCLMTDGGEMNVGQIVSSTGRELANVSKHLRQLADAGLLSRSKKGGLRALPARRSGCRENLRASL